MKKSLIAIAMISALAVSMSAASAQTVTLTDPQASFDTQLNQAKAAIGEIADAGLYRQNGSFDTQLNQAKAAIAKIAEEGLKAQASPIKQ